MFVITLLFSLLSESKKLITLNIATLFKFKERKSLSGKRHALIWQASILFQKVYIHFVSFPTAIQRADVNKRIQGRCMTVLSSPPPHQLAHCSFQDNAFLIFVWRYIITPREHFHLMSNCVLGIIVSYNNITNRFNCILYIHSFYS